MKSKTKQRSLVYVDPTTIAILGGDNDACNLALEYHAAMLRRLEPEMCAMLDRAEWNFLADVLNGSFQGDLILGMYQVGPAALALEVHDAQRLNGTGDKWFGEELQRGSGQAAADALEKKIRAMSPEQVCWIRTATNFFWSRAGIEKIDHTRDEWWTLRYRVDTLRDRAGGEDAG